MTAIDVAVVGGGPAGSSAARHLAGAGRTVTLVDEAAELRSPWVEQAKAAGVDVRSDTAVWGIDDDGRTLLTATADSVGRLSARAVLVATGATERVWPFPGWQLPAVMTSTAFRASNDAIGPDNRVLVAGSGWALVRQARSLAKRGVRVIGVVEAGRYRVSRTFLAAGSARALGTVTVHASALVRHRIPLWQGRVIVAARREGPDAKVTVDLAMTSAPAAVVARHVVDYVAVDFGRTPQVELLALLGCELSADGWTGATVPVHEDDGRCAEWVWAAGEVTGLTGGSDAAAKQGERAAGAILAALERRATPAKAPAGRGQLRLYPSPVQLASAWAAAVPDDCIVCRCESVAAGRIRTAGEGNGDPGAVKARTRAGMGVCQGRECGPLVAALAGTAGRATVRMPIRPVGLAALAGLDIPPMDLPPADGELTAAAGAP